MTGRFSILNMSMQEAESLNEFAIAEVKAEIGNEARMT
jgi:hypothetical protein